MLDALSAVLGAYTPRTDAERSDLARIRATVATGDAVSRSSPFHVTGSALIVDPASGCVLLRWHTRMQRWMQVGGHFDAPERDPLAVAMREAREESGLPDLVPLGDTPVLPVQIVIVPVPAHGAEPAHEHADIRYVLSTTQPDAARAEIPAARLRWVSIPTATSLVTEDNVAILLRRAATVAGISPPAP
jgi:8-oxo-dGTP pyrophosphatase MutT (NUDIX family)